MASRGTVHPVWGAALVGSDGEPKLDKAGKPKRKLQGWRARYVAPNGDRPSKTFQSKDAAIDWLNRKKADRRSGGNPSFIRLVEHWWADVQINKAATTAARYRDVLRVHLGIEIGADGEPFKLPKAKHRFPHTGTFANARVDDVTPREVTSYIRSLMQAGLSPGSVQKVATVLSAIFEVNRRDGEITYNPVHGVSKPSVPQPDTPENERLTPDEVHTLAKAMPLPQDRLVVYFAAYTGLRAGEIWGLRVGDIDLNARKVYVRRSITEAAGDVIVKGTKTGKPRIVPIGDDLAIMLTEQLSHALSGGNDRDSLLFPTLTGLPTRHKKWCTTTFRPTVKRALPHKPAFRFHALRHTFASIMGDRGVHPKVIQELLGHSRIGTTMDVYTHPGEEAYAAAAAAINGAMTDGAAVVPLRAAAE